MSETPFEPRVPTVFVPVTDMERSAAWYCRLLGAPKPPERPGEVYVFRLGGPGADLVLQRARMVRPSPHPLFSIPAPDPEQALHFLREHGVEIVQAGCREDGGATIRFRDPDGNVLLACRTGGVSG